MKKLVLLLLTTFTLSSCNNEDDKPTNPIDQLPPETQIGANTFGCLLDGKAFLPGNGTNPLDCVYQLVDGEFYFALQANKRNSENISVLIGLSTNAKEIVQNSTYTLAGIFNTTNDNIYTGELHITHLDQTNYIVSGTFWFDIIDFQGNPHQIREGRFDMQYTN
jgi:hypothetical protein